jgi:dethiobiotin synthetase
MNKFFITGIGTGIGKTLVSAIITEVLNADYWKPVQAGDLDNSDSQKVKDLISNTKTFIHPEVYRLTHAMSPHAAAVLDGVNIDLELISEFYDKIKNQKSLIVEGAGGLMVPLNDKSLVVDLIKKIEIPVILVSQNYLGSINHTLLSVEALKSRNIPIKGIVFNGPPNKESEEYILTYTGLKCLLRIPELNNISQAIIKEYASKFNL